MSDSYSNKSLVDKLGIKEDSRIAVINEPKNYFRLLEGVPTTVIINSELVKDLDLIHFFPKNRADLEKTFPDLKKNLKLELRVESLRETPDDPWPLALYSWGIN